MRWRPHADRRQVFGRLPRPPPIHLRGRSGARLPGKVLLDATGIPLVVHVARRAASAPSIALVVVATDDQRVQRAVEAHGFGAIMTRPDHPNGTARVAEAVEKLGDEAQVIVNVQGDEPRLEPALLDRLVARLERGEEPMATLACPFVPGEDPADPNLVKVVVGRDGRALYFSRASIPHDRDGEGHAPPLRHLGIYAYRRAFLPVYVGLPSTPAERAEKLEQLRALEHGHPIAVEQVEPCGSGIDTQAQYEAFVVEWKRNGGRPGAPAQPG